MSLDELVKPAHLSGLENVPSSADMKSDIEAAAAEAKNPSPKSKEEDPRWQPEYPFILDYTDKRGKKYKGDFVNKIVSIRDRQNIGIMRAQLAGGVSSDVLDGYTSDINMMVAHLTFSLTKRPPWAEDMDSWTDTSLLQALYQEVVSHENFFLGYTTIKDSGE